MTRKADVTSVQRTNDREERLTMAVAENLDALMTLDMRGYGVPRILYNYARKHYGAPLAMASAKRLLAGVAPNAAVLIGTGFVFPPYSKGELDGIVGAAVLARALERAVRAVPVIVVEEELVPAAQDLLRIAGLNAYTTTEQCKTLPHSAAVEAFTKDSQTAPKMAADLLDAWDPVAVMSIEKPGRNARSVYHMGNGSDVTSLAAKYDEVFIAADGRGIETYAIGDLGNEIGLGGLSDVVRSNIPFGATCACPCRGGLTAEIEADNVIVAATSDWGAYALSAALAFLTRDLSIAIDGEVLAELLDNAIRSGLIDGSGYAIPSVDGISKKDNCRFADMVRDVVRYPIEAMPRYARMYDMIADLQTPCGEGDFGGPNQ